MKLFVLDFDGVLTDGKIVCGEKGSDLRFFDASDGMGIVLLKNAGIPSVIISSRKSRALIRRAEELHVRECYQGISDKQSVLKKILKARKLKENQVCYVGDDLMDLPVLRRVGFAVGVQNAAREVKRVAHHVTRHSGGDGAVRELAEHILKTQGKWKQAIRAYTQDHGVK